MRLFSICRACPPRMISNSAQLIIAEAQLLREARPIRNHSSCLARVSKNYLIIPICSMTEPWPQKGSARPSHGAGFAQADSIEAGSCTCL